MVSIKPRITIVDNNDNIIGYKYRGTLVKDDIYRVSALWITNSNNEVLLAKRHRNKKHHPGSWGPSVAGTVDEGETYEVNILKEAEEELNLKNIEPALGPKIRVDNDYHHFTQWFLLKIDKDITDFKIQEDEVEKIKWFNQKELEEMLNKQPEDFIPGMISYLKLFEF